MSQKNFNQQLVFCLWAVGLGLIVTLWILSAMDMFSGGATQIIGATARLLGLIAAYSALVQLLLMGRIYWIERPFGLDSLARFHRLNGYVVLIAILSHVGLMITYLSLLNGTNFISQYIATVTAYPNVVQAAIAEILFILVVVSSIYIVRKRLRFESWYFVHLLAYLAVALAALHQFEIGSTLLSTPFATIFWYALYAFVALNVLVWRFGMPAYRFMTQDFRVVKVEKETPTVTSIYIQARDVSKLSVRPGQFILVRFLSSKLWWQEHPFTVSMIPKENMLRISVRDVGDFTHDLQSLQPGVRVVVSGPFGRFTSEKAVAPKRLFIAGGIGITPIRAMFEEATENTIDSVLLYANRTPSDVPLKSELEAIAAKNDSKIIYLYSDTKDVASGTITTGYIDAEVIRKHVADYMDRDIYLCGPPRMMHAIQEELTKLKFPVEQLHSEKFDLHP